MKVSPRPLHIDPSHLRTTPSLQKAQVVGKLHSPHNDGKIPGRNHNVKRQQYIANNQNSTKTTFFLQDKKTNASSANVHSETTLNSQVFRDSPFKEWEARYNGKQTDRMLNSKETTTIMAGQSKRSSNPVELQLYDLKAVYDIKEKEIKDLEETVGVFKRKINKAEEFMDKNKDLTKTLKERENTIERLKISLQSVNHEIEEMKLNKNNRSIQNIISEHYLTPRPNRKSKRVVLRTKSKSPSSTLRHIPADIRYKMYKEETIKKPKHSLRLQSPPSPKTRNLKSMLNTARASTSKNDSDSNILSAYFMNQIKDKNLMILNENRTGSMSHRNYGEQSKSRKWLLNNTEYSPSQRIHSESKNADRIRTVVKGYRPTEGYMSPVFNESSKSDAPIVSMFNNLLGKFSGVLEKYKVSEDKLLKQNKDLKKQLEFFKSK